MFLGAFFVCLFNLHFWHPWSNVCNVDDRGRKLGRAKIEGGGKEEEEVAKGLLGNPTRLSPLLLQVRRKTEEVLQD